MTEPDRPTVLVVEDEKDLADMFADWLSTDYDVRVAYDGETALDLVDDEVDVALLDRLMPGVSGDEVLADIEARGHRPRVAMITAVEPDLDVIEMGFDDYLVKPVFADDIRETVEDLLDRTSYDEQVQHYFALVSKRAALAEYRSETELEASEEFAELESSIDELEAELDRTIAEFDDAAFESAFRSIDPRPTGDH